MIFTVYGRLTTLNEYIEKERTNRHLAAKIKKSDTKEVKKQCEWQLNKGTIRPIDCLCDVKFIWHFKGKHDADNIAFAKKFILDGMVEAGLLPNDNPKFVRNLADEIIRVKSAYDEKVVVELLPVGD